jgi:hypothetical protein
MFIDPVANMATYYARANTLTEHLVWPSEDGIWTNVLGHGPCDYVLQPAIERKRRNSCLDCDYVTPSSKRSSTALKNCDALFMKATPTTATSLNSYHRTDATVDEEITMSTSLTVAKDETDEMFNKNDEEDDLDDILDPRFSTPEEILQKIAYSIIEAKTRKDLYKAFAQALAQCHDTLLAECYKYNHWISRGNFVITTAQIDIFVDLKYTKIREHRKRKCTI